MSNEKHNGWTNYATWRVALEYFDGWYREEGEEVSPDYLKDLVHVMLEEQAEGNALSYALAFISEVNWYEIAKHINSN